MDEILDGLKQIIAQSELTEVANHEALKSAAQLEINIKKLDKDFQKSKEWNVWARTFCGVTTLATSIMLTPVAGAIGGAVCLAAEFKREVSNNRDQDHLENFGLKVRKSISVLSEIKVVMTQNRKHGEEMYQNLFTKKVKHEKEGVPLLSKLSSKISRKDKKILRELANELARNFADDIEKAKRFDKQAFQK